VFISVGNGKKYQLQKTFQAWIFKSRKTLALLQVLVIYQESGCAVL
jgi:hypothetical protein